MAVAESALKGMLKGITDPKLRAQYGNIISGKYPHRVYCLNPQPIPGGKKLAHAKKCAIGFLDANGVAIDAQTTDKKTGEVLAGIETSRDRFDGRKGFKCYCGNNSIRAAEEEKVIGTIKDVPIFARPPKREELEKIFGELQKSGKGPLQFVNGWAEYDGFGLEEVQA